MHDLFFTSSDISDAKIVESGQDLTELQQY